MKIKIRKDKKASGASYKLIRERCECDKELLNEDKRQRFIVGDIDSILIGGAINVLNFSRTGKRMFFEHDRTDSAIKLAMAST